MRQSHFISFFLFFLFTLTAPQDLNRRFAKQPIAPVSPIQNTKNQRPKDQRPRTQKAKKRSENHRIHRSVYSPTDMDPNLDALNSTHFYQDSPYVRQRWSAHIETARVRFPGRKICSACRMHLACGKGSRCAFGGREMEWNGRQDETQL